jgi:predicted Zn-dependent protease
VSAAGRPSWILACSCLLAGAVGCSALPLGDDQPPPASHDYRERREAAVTTFDKQRDEAQYQAALARWREDDPAGTRQLLKQLLSRSPGHRAGRALQAELLVWEQRNAEAAALVRELLSEQPDDPALHHTLALALEALGDAEAEKHYRRAAELAPQHPAYAVSLELATQGAAAVPSSPAPRR